MVFPLGTRGAAESDRLSAGGAVASAVTLNSLKDNLNLMTDTETFVAGRCRGSLRLLQGVA